MANRGQWKPGESGNPNGRPPKSRALTEILEKAGRKTVEYEGKRISGKRLLARLVWEGILTARVHLPNGMVLEVSPADWIGLVKWLYQHVDGPPKGELDLTSGGRELVFRVIYGEDRMQDTPAGAAPKSGVDS